jgi:hypothetical protein
MIHSRLILVGVCLISLQLAGCSAMESPVSATRRMTRMMTPKPFDNEKEVDSDDGEWDFVGDEGRAGIAREQDPDPWFGKYILSDKARAIERNLGVDY